MTNKLKYNLNKNILIKLKEFFLNHSVIVNLYFLQRNIDLTIDLIFTETIIFESRMLKIFQIKKYYN